MIVVVVVVEKGVKNYDNLGCHIQVTIHNLRCGDGCAAVVILFERCVSV